MVSRYAGVTSTTQSKSPHKMSFHRELDMQITKFLEHNKTLIMCYDHFSLQLNMND